MSNARVVQNKESSLAVVYLARGVGNGLASAINFFEAYRDFPPGCPHDLIVIAKGWPDIEGRKALEHLAESHAARIIDLPDDGFDWGAYMRLAPVLPQIWLCFLNTHSLPRVSGWLKLMLNCAQSPKAGAVGATASWGTMIPTWPLLKPRGDMTILSYPIRLAHDALIFAMNASEFPSFPNPHLRSNAFLVKRKLFNEFIEIRTVPRSKRDVHILESGKDGFTQFLIDRRLTPFVVGANGLCYKSIDWIISNTFRVPGQSNLIVADNQTIAYDNASKSLRKRLELAAWGKTFTN